MTKQDTYFEIYNQLLSEKLKSTSLSIQSAVIASMNISTMLVKNFEAIDLVLKKTSSKMQQSIIEYNDASKTLNETIANALQNITNSYDFSKNINESIAKAIQHSVNNISSITKSFKINIEDNSKLDFTDIADSFNELVDSSEICNNDENLKAEVNTIKEVLTSNSSLAWKDWLSLVITILSLLISFASYMNSNDHYYQEKYLKLLEHIDSTCQQISENK